MRCRACRRVGVLLVCILLLVTSGCSRQSFPEVEGAIVVSPEGLTAVVEGAISMSAGADWWRIQSIFQDAPGRHIVAVRTYAYLWLFRLDGSDSRLFASVDLRKLDATYTQGTTLPDFSFSPDGRYVAINNAEYDSLLDRSYPIYIVDVVRGHAIEIGEGNAAHFLRAWSPSGGTFAHVSRKGDQLVIYDSKRGRTMAVPLSLGTVNSVALKDDEVVLIGTTDGLYEVSTRTKSRPKRLPISGEFLGLVHGETRVLNRGSIYALPKNGQVRLVSEASQNARIVRNYGAQTVMSNHEETWVHSASGEVVHYRFNLDYSSSVLFSPDGRQYLLSNQDGLRLRSADGTVDRLIDQEWASLGTRCRWLDDGTLLRLEHGHLSQTLDLKIVTENLSDGSRTTLFGR